MTARSGRGVPGVPGGIETDASDDGPAKRATVRFYAELRDFLGGEDATTGTVVRRFHVPGSVKDMIEGCGVPHTEVELIVVDGRSVGFDYQVQDGDRIGVFPVFESFDVSPLVRLRPEPLRDTRFVADVHLGRLARFLRLLGFDTVWDRASADPDLVRISVEDGRILLTRDVELLKHGSLTHGLYVRETDPERQVAEVVDRLHLADRIDPFTRCMKCNGVLESVDKAAIEDRIPAGTSAAVDDFVRCTGCGQVFWKGAHADGLRRIVELARRDPSELASPPEGL